MTDENPYSHIRIEDVPKSTWRVRGHEGQEDLVVAHIAIPPNNEYEVWQFFDKVPTEDGEGLEMKLVTFMPEDMVESMVLLDDDGNEVRDFAGLRREEAE